MRNLQTDNPPPYNIAVGISLPHAAESPPPYSIVMPETPVTNPVVVGSQQEPIDYKQNLCYNLRALWNRCTTHKCSMVLAPFFILLSSISFAALIIGGGKRWSCPANPNVPAWLIVFGVMGIIWFWSTAFLIVGRAICDDPYRKRCKWLLIAISILFLAFFFAWSIVGFVWTSNSTSVNDMNCDSTVYKFASGLCITQMVIIICSFGCLCG